MNKELSDFAARLRGIISSLVAAEVTRLKNLESPGGISTLIRLGPPHVGCYKDFDALARELFALQFKYNPAYRKICEARRVTPEVVEHWTQIPAVPTAAFKELELTCLPPDERTLAFHSSGTTEQTPSRHYHCRESLKIYETSLWSWFVPNVLSDLRFPICDFRLVYLAPVPQQAPHSSLVHMFETVRQELRRRFGAPPSGGRVNAELQTEADATFAAYFGKVGADGSWTLDFDAVLAALNSSLATRLPVEVSAKAGHPTLLLGTAFSFVHLLDYLEENNLRFKLPVGSRVMETGGYKNRSRSMPKAELHALITERLGILPENIICEYGMSELSSQAYAVASGKWQVARSCAPSCHLSLVTCHFRFPPWARTQIISPETGLEVVDGETGLIRVFDLANVFSVMAIQTEDLGIRRGDGFELIGRARLAEPRGCSLMTA